MPIVSGAAMNEIQKQIDSEKTKGRDGPMVEISVVKVRNAFHARIVEPDRGIYTGFGVKEVTSGRSGWEALAKMADNWKRAGFMEGTEYHDEPVEEAIVDLKAKFPSHSVRDVLDKLYDKFTAYRKVVQLAVKTDKSKAGHLKLVEKALDMFVDLLSSIKAAERSLY